MAIEIRVKGVLFDMDGVLVDSTPSVLRSWRRWCVEHNVPNAETLTFPHGQRAVDLVKMLAPWADVQQGLARIDEIELDDLADIVVLPGAQALTSSLPADKWTIVTSARRALLEARLRAAGLPMPQHTVSADDVEEGKPHPEPYLRGAAVLGFAASDCLVVEDAPSGVRAGKAAGARVLAVVTTTAEKELRTAGADWVVRSLGDVKATREGDDVLIALEAI